MPISGSVWGNIRGVLRKTHVLLENRHLISVVLPMLQSYLKEKGGKVLRPNIGMKEKDAMVSSSLTQQLSQNSVPE